MVLRQVPNHMERQAQVQPPYEKEHSQIPCEVLWYNTAASEPKEVILSDGVTKVTVPVFPFGESLKSLLTNPDVIHDDNLISENFDKRTWRPTKKYADMDPNDRVDDLNSGYLLERGIELFCNAAPSQMTLTLSCPVACSCSQTNHFRTATEVTELHLSA